MGSQDDPLGRPPEDADESSESHSRARKRQDRDRGKGEKLTVAMLAYDDPNDCQSRWNEHEESRPQGAIVGEATHLEEAPYLGPPYNAERRKRRSESHRAREVLAHLARAFLRPDDARHSGEASTTRSARGCRSPPAGRLHCAAHRRCTFRSRIRLRWCSRNLLQPRRRRRSYRRRWRNPCPHRTRFRPPPRTRRRRLRRCSYCWCSPSRRCKRHRLPREVSRVLGRNRRRRHYPRPIPLRSDPRRCRSCTYRWRNPRPGNRRLRWAHRSMTCCHRRPPRPRFRHRHPAPQPLGRCS